MNRLPCLDNGTSEAGTCMTMLIFLHQYWFMKTIIWSVDLWSNEYTVIMSGNFSMGCYLILTRAISFYQTSNFWISITVFSFSEACCWASIAYFSKLSFGEISLWTEVWLLLLPLRVAFLAEISTKWFPWTSRDSSLQCPKLLPATMAGKCILSNNC